jgi:hypothetical protein
MTAKDAILRTLDTADRFTKSYLKDLTAADLLIRAVPGQNHMAWQLGHLLMSERGMMEGIRPGTSPELPAGFEEGHGRDKFNIDDPSKYHSPEEYLALIDAQRAATKRLIDELSDADLDAPGPERMQKMAPTVGAVLMLSGNHYLMHAGQYVSVRRQLGKPIAI